MTAAVAALQAKNKKRAVLCRIRYAACVFVCVCVLYLPALFASVILAMACSKGETIPNTLISYFTSKQTLSTPDSLTPGQSRTCVCNTWHAVSMKKGGASAIFVPKMPCPLSRSVHKARSQGAWSKRPLSLSLSVCYLKGIK